MIKSVRLGAAAVAVALLAAGCAGGGGDKVEATGEVDTSATLRVATPAPFNNLDPVRQTVVGDSMFTTLIYDRLTMLDANDELQPMLAESWEFAEDGSHLDFRLRDDLTFHDGTALDAEAVKVNIERGQSLSDSSVKQYLTSIEKVEVVDPLTVRLHLADGRGAELPAAMATNVGMMVSPLAIEKNADAIASGEISAGSGPYEVDSFTPSEKMSLTAADDYWNPEAGQTAGLEVEFVASAATRLNGVRTGSVDLAAISSASDLMQAEELVDSGELDLTSVTYRSVLGLMLNASMGDMQDERARQAVAHAIDPEVINDLFSGTCAPHRQIYPEGEWAASTGYDYPYAFDQDKARSLVKEVGDISIELSFPAGSNTEQPANVLQAALQDVGIDAQLNPVPVTESNARFQAGEFESLVTASFAPQADPAATVDLYLTGGFQLARSEQDKQNIRELADPGADPTLTQEERSTVYQAVFERTLDEAWFIPVCNVTTGIVHSPLVLNTSNIPWATQGLQDLRYVAVSK